MSELKKCGMCAEWLHLTEFGSHPATRDRLQNACKLCKAAYQRGLRHQHGELEDAYVERHAARRAEESMECLEESSPIETESSVQHQPVDLDRFFRTPTGRSRGWRAV